MKVGVDTSQLFSPEAIEAKLLAWEQGGIVATRLALASLVRPLPLIVVTAGNDSDEFPDGSGGSHLLLDWEVLAGETWQSRAVSLAAFEGQTVTLYFEQGDNQEGFGEHRYVDNVRIAVE